MKPPIVVSLEWVPPFNSFLILVRQWLKNLNIHVFYKRKITAETIWNSLHSKTWKKLCHTAMYILLFWVGFYLYHAYYKDISTPDFSTPSFSPGPFNPILFNYELLNHWVEKFMVEKFMVEKSGVEKSGVEKSEVEISFNLLERWHFNPRLFNHELFNHEFLNHGVEKFMVEKSGVGKFMVEKSGVERFGIEVWGWKVWGWNVLQPLKRSVMRSTVNFCCFPFLFIVYKIVSDFLHFKQTQLCPIHRIRISLSLTINIFSLLFEIRSCLR